MEIDPEELIIDTEYNLQKNLIYIKEIDKGAFSKVIHVRDKRTKEDFALKIINRYKKNIDIINRIKEEILILKKLRHKNIVKYFNHWETLDHLFIKFEYLKYGTLKQWMEKNKKISEEQASIIIKNILSAISYLHQNQICHKDLKPENIMFSEENDLTSIKIIDFGLSLHNFDSLLKSDYSGTMIYMAPEELERKSYYLSVDIWSIGILMFMLLNKGEHPYYKENDTKQEFLKKLKNKKFNINNKISLMGMDLLKKLLEYDPIKRYKSSDALNHPWITRNPEDKIPQTLNEQLNTYNIINNAKELIMINIFLNYFKKHYFLYQYNNGISGKKRLKKNNYKKNINKSNVYIIGYEYIKKCDFYSKSKKAKTKELIKKYLSVSKYVDKSEEKTNINLNSNINSTSNNNLPNSNSLISINTNNKKITYRKINNLLFKKKSNLSESKHNNLNTTKRKKINYETSLNNINNIDLNKKKRIFLVKNTSRIVNYHNYTQIKNLQEKEYNFINKNKNSIKPNNLFSKEKSKYKSKTIKTTHRSNLPHIHLGKINNIDEMIFKQKIPLYYFRLPNIKSYNINLHRNKKQKKISIINYD